MAKNDLTAQRLRELLDYNAETGTFVWRVKTSTRNSAGAVAGWTEPNGYKRLCIDSRKVWAHRAAWLYMTGNYPEHHIDHIDGNPLNNRFQNLRDVSQRANVHNQRRAHSQSTTGLLGVQRAGKRFVARIEASGVNIGLGRFDTPEEAHAAYIKAKRLLHEGCTI